VSFTAATETTHLSSGETPGNTIDEEMEGCFQIMTKAYPILFYSHFLPYFSS